MPMPRRMDMSPVAVAARETRIVEIRESYRADQITACGRWIASWRPGSCDPEPKCTCGTHQIGGAR